jgi:hypothetical protein
VTCDRLEREDLLGRLGEELPPHIHECPDCRASVGAYTRLAALLGRDSERRLPDRWKERTLARLQGRRTRRRVAVALGVTIAAAFAVIVVLAIRDSTPVPPAAELLAWVETGPGWRGEEQSGAKQNRKGRPGDTLHVSSPPSTAENVELRVYRETRELLVRCPGAAAAVCRRVGDQLEVTWRLPSVGTYQVVWLVSSSPLPAPAGDVNTDIRAARRSGARATESEPVDVF